MIEMSELKCAGRGTLASGDRVGTGCLACSVPAKQKNLFAWVGTVTATLALTLALCAMFTPPAHAQNLTYIQDPKWQAPPEASAKVNPLANKPQLAAGGKKIFLRDCAQCHRPDGTGLPPAANLTLPLVQQQSDGALFWKITQGNTGKKMPSFSGTPDAQRWQVVLFLRTLERSARAGQ